MLINKMLFLLFEYFMRNGILKEYQTKVYLHLSINYKKVKIYYLSKKILLN